MGFFPNCYLVGCPPRPRGRSRRPRRARWPPSLRMLAAERHEQSVAIRHATCQGDSVPARANSSCTQPCAQRHLQSTPPGAHDSLFIARVPVCAANHRLSPPCSTRSRRTTSWSSSTTRHVPPRRPAANAERQPAGAAAAVDGRGFLLLELGSTVRTPLALALLSSLSSHPCRYTRSFASVRAPWPLRPHSRPPAWRPNPRPIALMLTPWCCQLPSHRPKGSPDEI